MDGNLINDGTLTYTYDAENRLIAAYSGSTLVISNAYDHQSRRVLKTTPTATHAFLYDGWNLVQETIATTSSVTTNHYIWGKDLSGTMQGAGGVGGLVAASINGLWFFPLYDNNGNITAYVDDVGSIVAEYRYDAFGNTISQSGSHSDTFPHRFSTKYFDAETGLYYYGYRFYSPELMRWLNRDPIEEKGGQNIYGFVRNMCLVESKSADIARYQLLFSIEGEQDAGVRDRGRRASRGRFKAGGAWGGKRCRKGAGVLQGECRCGDAGVRG